MAADSLGEILSVDGVGGIFIGPMDLATNMGYLGDPGHQRVQDTIARVEEKALGASKVLAAISGSWEQAQRLYEKGYQMVTLMADGVSLVKLAADKVAQCGRHIPKARRSRKSVRTALVSDKRHGRHRCDWVILETWPRGWRCRSFCDTLLWTSAKE